MTGYINQNYFDKKQRTEKEKRAMYYVIGACYGSYAPLEIKSILKDGSIAVSKGIRFKSQHKELVEIVHDELHDELESEHAIISDQSQRRGPYPDLRNSHWFDAYGVPALYDRLGEMGLNAPKPERQFPEYIPQKYLSDFVRGFFDSQGSVKRMGKFSQVHYSFYRKFLSAQHELFKEAGVRSGKIHNGRIEYHPDDSLTIYKIMYLGWKRKRGLYLKEKKMLFNPNYKPQRHDLTYGSVDERIKKAKKLLAKNMLVKEVALMLGYRKIDSFSELFKKKTDQTPSEFRAEQFNKETHQ